MTDLEERLAAGRRVVLLVRHGRTAWNAAGRFLGRTDIPLDDVGRAQAAALGARWRPRIARVWCSPARRALETAGHLGDPTVLPDLAEVAHGALEGLTLADGVAAFPDVFRAWDADPTSAALPGGESLGAARDRAISALQGISVGEPGLVAVVSHQLTLGAVLATLAGAPLREWRRFALPPAGARWVAWDGGRWEMGEVHVAPDIPAEIAHVRP